jgi:hypothetical protein
MPKMACPRRPIERNILPHKTSNQFIIMIQKLAKISLMTLVTAALLGLPAVVSAQTNTSTNSTIAKSKPLPFIGRLGSVDKTAMTFTLDEKTKPGRTFEVTSETRIMKEGKPATLADGVVGYPVRGSYTKTADGKLEAHTVSFGAKVDPAKTSTAPSTNNPAPPK